MRSYTAWARWSPRSSFARRRQLSALLGRASSELDSSTTTGCAGAAGTSKGGKVFAAHGHPPRPPSTLKENEEWNLIFDNFTFFEEDILGTDKYGKILPDKIIHLASIPGVRKSLQDPLFYVKNNLTAFVYLLEECKKHNIKEVIYASSSSVYGANKKVPFNNN